MPRAFPALSLASAVAAASLAMACGEVATSTSPTNDAGAVDANATTPVLDASRSECGEVVPGTDLDPMYRAGAFGLYRVRAAAEECSGLGGATVVLERIVDCGAAPASVQWGGHGCVAGPAWSTGDLAVVVAEKAPAPAPRPKEWCVGELPAASAYARATDRVASESEGRAVLAKHGCQ